MFKKNNNFLFQQLSQADNLPYKKDYKDQYPMNKPSKPKLNSQKQQKQNHTFHGSYSTNILKGHREDQHYIVLEIEDYAELEIVLSKQIQVLNQNIALLKQKNHLKNKQIQSLAKNINKMTQKGNALQSKIAQKQKRLQAISLKRKRLSEQALFQQQKLKKQQTILKEQLQKCSQLSQNIASIQTKIQQGLKQLDTIRKRTSKYQQTQQQNHNLKDYLRNLEEQQRMIQQDDIHQRDQCNQLQQKLKSLKNVYNQRSKINQRNLVKLNQIKTEVANLTRAKESMAKKQHEIKNLEMEMGDLNQQILLINEDLSELDFKIRKRQKTISQLKGKLNEGINQKSYMTYNAIQESETPKESYRVVQSDADEPLQKLAPRSIKTPKHLTHSPRKQQTKIQQKKTSPFIIKTNITPTFTPHEHDKAEGSITSKRAAQQVQDSDAFKNIQKLISRFQQIKTKEKHKH